jgi:hypothetical protein
MYDKPFVAEACPPMSHASASNGLSDIETHIENAPSNRPLKNYLFNIKKVFFAGFLSSAKKRHKKKWKNVALFLSDIRNRTMCKSI